MAERPHNGGPPEQPTILEPGRGLQPSAPERTSVGRCRGDSQSTIPPPWWPPPTQSLLRSLCVYHHKYTLGRGGCQVGWCLCWASRPAWPGAAPRV